MTRRLATAAAVLVALALAGCGGDGGDGGTNAGTGQDLVARADAICKEANAKEMALGAEGAGWMYGEQFDDPEFLSQFSDIAHDAVRELRTLEPSPEDREFMETVIASIDRMAQALDSRVEVLRSGKEESRAVREYVSGYSDLTAAAGPLGLTECQGVLL